MKRELPKDLAFAASWHGSRCQEARSCKEGDIVAAAICVSMLRELKDSMRRGKVSQETMTNLVDEFIDHAGMVETEGPMGVLGLERKT